MNTGYIIVLLTYAVAVLARNNHYNDNKDKSSKREDDEEEEGPDYSDDNIPPRYIDYGGGRFAYTNGFARFRSVVRNFEVIDPRILTDKTERKGHLDIIRDVGGANSGQGAGAQRIQGSGSRVVFRESSHDAAVGSQSSQKHPGRKEDGNRARGEVGSIGKLAVNKPNLGAKMLNVVVCRLHRSRNRRHNNDLRRTVKRLEVLRRRTELRRSGTPRARLAHRARRLINDEWELEIAESSQLDRRIPRVASHCSASSSRMVCCSGSSYSPLEGASCCGRHLYFPKRGRYKCVNGNLFMIGKWSKSSTNELQL